MEGEKVNDISLKAIAGAVKRMKNLNEFEFLIHHVIGITNVGYDSIIEAFSEKAQMKKFGISISPMTSINDSSMELTTKVLSNFTELEDLLFFMNGKNDISISGILSISQAILNMTKLESLKFLFLQTFGFNSILNFFRSKS